MFSAENNILFGGADVSLDGLKIAEVITNQDHTGREIVGVRVLGTHNMESKNPDYWIPAFHCAPSNNTSGEIPKIGSKLYGMFLNKNPNIFVYFGYVRYLQG